MLNAKHHEQEAEIIAQAGRPEMHHRHQHGRSWYRHRVGRQLEPESAGAKPTRSVRGKQGRSGSPRSCDWQKRHHQVLAAGGLQMIGTERHESRRIDNQLRGRAGRQGDAGSSRFYLSLEDSLMRIFASDRVKNFMKALGMQGEAIEHRMVTHAIEKAQRKVEGRNFDIRKQLLEFDDVNNEQRKVIYHMRNKLLAADNIGEPSPTSVRRAQRHGQRSTFHRNRARAVGRGRSGERWPAELTLHLAIQQWLDEDDHLYEETLRESGSPSAPAYNEKEDQAGAEAAAHLREAVTPADASTTSGKTTCRPWITCVMASTCVVTPRRTRSRNTSASPSRCSPRCWIRSRASRRVFLMTVQIAGAAKKWQAVRKPRWSCARAVTSTPTTKKRGRGAQCGRGRGRPRPSRSCASGQKVGRNDPCPCGSGKKYKHCHGQLA